MKLNLDLTLDILANFIKEETEKIGLKNVVLGLSGGIGLRTQRCHSRKGSRRRQGLCLLHAL